MKKALLLLESRVRTTNVLHAQKIDPCVVNAKLSVKVIGIPCYGSAINV